MVTLIDEEVIRQELLDFLSDVSDDVVRRLKDLCLIFNKTEEEIASSLIAFLVRNNIFELPTLDTIDQFERCDLVKIAGDEQKSTKKKEKRETRVSMNTGKVLDRNFIQEYSQVLKATENTTTIEPAVDDDESESNATVSTG